MNVDINVSCIFSLQADESSVAAPFTSEEASSYPAKLPEVTEDKLYPENGDFTVESGTF
jgi:hypothetical protein